MLAREIDDETPGMFSRPLRGGTLKFLCLSVLESGNLIGALYRFTQFFRLLLEDLAFTLEKSDDLLRLALTPTTEAVRCNHFAQEMMLKLAHGMASGPCRTKDPLGANRFCILETHPRFRICILMPYRLIVHERAYEVILQIRCQEKRLAEFLAQLDICTFVSFAERIVSHRVREYLETRLGQVTSIKDVAHALHFSHERLQGG